MFKRLFSMQSILMFILGVFAGPKIKEWMGGMGKKKEDEEKS